ncbi:MAG: TetR/AcrR family transcriptional regulator [Firmicutes bacterium]|nr:TetR/AcrR family transcriptional regulator [Bacillota bacterium]
MDISDIQRQNCTKEKILYAAAMMYSKQGYEKISMRDLADAVGIRVSSLYNHFESKEDILYALYSAYSVERQRSKPNMDDLLRLAETAPPREVLWRPTHNIDPGVANIMDRIMAIATHRVATGADSALFVKNNLLDIWLPFLKPLLTRMTELGKIEPVDIDTFIYLVSVYSFGATALNNSNMEISREEWAKGYAMLCTLIRPTGK